MKKYLLLINLMLMGLTMANTITEVNINWERPVSSAVEELTFSFAGPNLVKLSESGNHNLKLDRPFNASVANKQPFYTISPSNFSHDSSSCCYPSEKRSPAIIQVIMKDGNAIRIESLIFAAEFRKIQTTNGNYRMKLSVKNAKLEGISFETIDD
jgi:hypothetical protein